MMFQGSGGVAWSAHIAGFVTGVGFGMLTQFTSLQNYIENQNK